jgi:spermidine synthase
MAMEMLLTLLFQNLFGYVYTRLGLIVAAFMLGAAVGAPCGRFLACRSRRSAWLTFFSIEALFALLPLAVWAVAVGSRSGSGGLASSALELFLYGAVTLTGWMVGVEFPLVNHLYRQTGRDLGSSAAVMDAADHIGAALGALGMGVVLVPVLGVFGAGAVLAAFKVLGVGLVVSAALCMWRPPQA